jgi:hypothetical protein
MEPPLDFLFKSSTTFAHFFVRRSYDVSRFFFSFPFSLYSCTWKRLVLPSLYRTRYAIDSTTRFGVEYLYIYVASPCDVFADTTPLAAS